MEFVRKALCNVADVLILSRKMWGDQKTYSRLSFYKVSLQFCPWCLAGVAEQQWKYFVNF